MFIGNHELVTLEGVLCKKPVLSYTDPNIPIVADGKEIPSPFLPTSKDPKKIAEKINMIFVPRNANQIELCVNLLYSI